MARIINQKMSGDFRDCLIHKINNKSNKIFGGVLKTTKMLQYLEFLKKRGSKESTKI